MLFKRQTLSLTVIVKNEEVHLPNLLETASIYADEIIIVDTGSTDRTKEIAKKYTTKIFDFVWCDDFSKARNYGIERCTGEFIIWLDADDVVPKDMAKKLNDLKNKPIDWDVLYIPYIYTRNKDGTPSHTQLRERIFRSNKQIVFKYPIHEGLSFPLGLKYEHDESIHIIHNKIVFHEPSVVRNARILAKAVETPEYRDSDFIWGLLARESEPQKAIAYYARIFSETRSDRGPIWLSETSVGYGRKLLEVQRYDEALEVFVQAIGFYPLWREPYFYAAQAYFNLKRYKEALRMLLIAGDISPQVTESYLTYDMSIYDGDWYYEWLFFIYRYLEDRNKALEVMDKVLKRNPGSEIFLKLKKEMYDWLYPSQAEQKSS